MLKLPLDFISKLKTELYLKRNVVCMLSCSIRSEGWLYIVLLQTRSAWVTVLELVYLFSSCFHRPSLVSYDVVCGAHK